MDVGTYSPIVSGNPTWLKEFAGRDWILPEPAKLLPAEFPDVAAVRVKVNSPGGVLAGVNEVQTITIDATGGTFTVAVGAQVTGNIAYNASAETLEAALEGLSNVAPGDVQVTKAGSVFTLTFGGAYGKQNVAPVVTDPALLTGGASTAVVATQTAGVAAATAIPVDATLGPIPAGTPLRFAAGVMAYVTAAAATGATSLTVDAITADIPDDSVAYYSRTGKKQIVSGSLIGRTLAERNAYTAYGLAVDTDDEIYFIPFDVVDANTNADCEKVRHGATIAENHLPLSVREHLAANAGLMTKVRTLYNMINAEA